MVKFFFLIVFVILIVIGVAAKIGFAVQNASWTGFNSPGF
jgi:hypothetical protein